MRLPAQVRPKRISTLRVGPAKLVSNYPNPWQITHVHSRDVGFMLTQQGVDPSLRKCYDQPTFHRRV
jgi:hypothetical protein